MRLEHLPWPHIIRRLIVRMAATVLVCVLLALQASVALATTPKPVSVIDRDVVLLGDLFDGLEPEKAIHVLGPAPKPGKDMVINARTLMRIASALGVNWSPKTASEQVIVRRSGNEIDEDSLTKLIEEALKDKGIEGPVEIRFSQKPDVILDEKDSYTLTLSAFDFDTLRGTFTGDVRTGSGATGSFAGLIQRKVRVPVLKAPLGKDTILSESDLHYLTLLEKDVPKGALIDAKDLIGMSPQRILMAEKPVFASDLQAPQLVDRGETVTLLYHQGAMSLTTIGKATQPGRKGEMIRVLNLSSNKSVQALVTDERTVEVQ